MSQPGTSVEPFRAYQFKLLIAGIPAAHFTECSALDVSDRTHKESAAVSNQVVHSLPGQTEYSHVKLSYGVTNSQEFYDWLEQTLAGDIEHKNVSIVLLDETGMQEILRYNLIGAWPSQFQGAGSIDLAGSVAVESLVLIYDQIERVA